MAKFKRNRKAQDAPRTVEQFKPLIKKLAYRAVSRAVSANIFLEVEDMEQELSILFLKTVKTYDENAGRSFINYFISGAYWRINHIIKGLVIRCADNITISGDSMRAEEGEYDIWDSLVCEGPTPEDLVLEQEFRDEVRQALDGKALQFYDLLTNPPQELLDEFDNARLGAAEMRTKGERVRMPQELNWAFLTKIFPTSADESLMLQSQIKQAIADAV